MNGSLASIIRDMLLGVPVIELFGGLVYTQTKRETIFRDDDDETGRAVDKRFPVSCDYTGTVDCEHSGLKDFIPNSKIKGLLYFEDNGVSVEGMTGRTVNYRSRMRIVVWLNNKYVNTPSCSVSAAIMNAIVAAISGKNPFNSGDFKRITISIEGVPRMAADIFGRYTYDEAVTQYLMPPFEYFAIDIAVRFSVNPECINSITEKQPDSC